MQSHDAETQILPRDIVEAMKWHVLARAAGVEDACLDGELGRLTPPQRAEVEQRVRRQVQP